MFIKINRNTHIRERIFPYYYCQFILRVEILKKYEIQTENEPSSKANIVTKLTQILMFPYVKEKYYKCSGMTGRGEKLEKCVYNQKIKEEIKAAVSNRWKKMSCCSCYKCYFGKNSLKMLKHENNEI